MGLPRMPGCRSAHSTWARYASARSTAALLLATLASRLHRRCSAFERAACPSLTPLALAAARPALVRSAIIFRSCSASDAQMCRVKSSRSFPNSATMKCTRCSMSPLMKCTLRDRRSSLETISGHRADFACLSAVASPGTQHQRIRSSACLHVLVPKSD